MKDERIEKVAVGAILPNPFQPVSRINIDMITAQRFAESIEKDGLQQVPVCRVNSEGKHEMADGWLRLAGFRWLNNRGKKGYEMLPVIVRELTDREMADAVMAANTVRKDLNPIEIAQFFKNYLGEFQVTQEELGKQHGVSQGEIANTLRLLDLPLEIQGRVITQEISPTHGRTLLQLAERPEKMQELAGKIKERGWSVADLDRAIKDIIKPPVQVEMKEGAVLPLEKSSEKSGGADETGSNTKAAVPPASDEDGEDEEKPDENLEGKPDEKPPKKVSLSELKAVAKLRKVVLTELPEGVRVAIGPEGAVPFIKTVACELGDVPLKMLLEEARK